MNPRMDTNKHESNKRKPVYATQVRKSQIITELYRTIDGLESSYREADGVIRDPEIRHAIACHKAAHRVIAQMPATVFPLGSQYSRPFVSIRG
jgi:hypothetical protein